MSEPVRLFCTDLDGTVLGNPEATWRFASAWESIPRGLRPLLIYNTGRTVADTRTLVSARHLPEPDYIIGGIGTEFHAALYHLEDDFHSRFGPGWDLERIEEIVRGFPGVRRQPSECLHAFKSSWFWVRASRADIAELEDRLRAAGIEAHVDYSCRYFLDVVPACAGKGNALAWLCRRLGVEPAHVLVAGDTGNDCSMYRLPGVRGIAVGNALPELLGEVPAPLVFVASQTMADGVLEGLQHFGVIERLPMARDGTFWIRDAERGRGGSGSR